MRSRITFWTGPTAALWRGSTTRSRCSSAAAMGSSILPICSSVSFWTSKVIDYLPELWAETTTYGIFHGKSQRAVIASPQDTSPLLAFTTVVSPSDETVEAYFLPQAESWHL